MSEKKKPAPPPTQERRETQYGPEFPPEIPPAETPPEPRTGEIVPRPPGANGVGPRRLPPIVPGMSLAECPASFDTSSHAGKVKVFNAQGIADYDFDAQGVVTIRAVDWLIYPDELPNEETGEIEQFATLVLFDKDGKTFKTTSQFAPRKLQAAVELFSPRDWREGVVFQVRIRLTKNKRNMHDIRVLIDEEHTG